MTRRRRSDFEETDHSSSLPIIAMMQSAMICIPKRRDPTRSSAGGTPVDWVGQMSVLVLKNIYLELMVL